MSDEELIEMLLDERGAHLTKEARKAIAKRLRELGEQRNAAIIAALNDIWEAKRDDTDRGRK